MEELKSQKDREQPRDYQKEEITAVPMKRGSCP